MAVAPTLPAPGPAKGSFAGPVAGGRARRALPAWAYAVGVVVVLGAAAAGVMAGSGDGAANRTKVAVATSADRSVATAPVPTVDTPAAGGGGVTIQPSGEVLTSTAATHRPGRLFGGDVKLRPQPDTIGDEIQRFQGRDGAGLVVLTGPENGWYRVQLDGAEGWMYGGFVDDPSDPACALEWVPGTPRVVLDLGGNPIATTEASSSGSKLFASGPEAAGRWPVTLADGREGTVDGGAIYEAAC